MFTKYKKRKKERILKEQEQKMYLLREKSFHNNIEDEETQLNLIKEIQLGNIIFDKQVVSMVHKSTLSYFENRWISRGGAIQMWFETSVDYTYSFTYLSMNGVDLPEDKIKYYTQIVLAIQNKNSEIELDPKPEYVMDIPTFDNWINPKPKKEMTIRVLKSGVISNKTIK